MVALLLFQGWDNLTADGLRFPAARVEVTAAGRVNRARHVAFKDDTLAA